MLLSWSIMERLIFLRNLIIMVQLCLQPCSMMRGEVTTSRPKSRPNRSSTCRVSAHTHTCKQRLLHYSSVHHGLTVSGLFFVAFSSSLWRLAQLMKLQADMEALREQRESTICTTREELYSAQEEVPPLPDLLT